MILLDCVHNVTAKNLRLREHSTDRRLVELLMPPFLHKHTCNITKSHQ